MRGRVPTRAPRTDPIPPVERRRAGAAGVLLALVLGCLLSASASAMTGPRPPPAAATGPAPLAPVGPVDVSLTAVPVAGTIPFTVNFTASATGGSGTYLLYLWHFGDGHDGEGRSVLYTYVTAGAFNATVSVTDSNGRVGNASVTIQARADSPDAPATNGSPTVPLWVALVLAAILGLMVAWVVVLRRDRLESVQPGSLPDSPGPAPAPPPPDGRIGGGWSGPAPGLPLEAPAAPIVSTTRPGGRLDPRVTGIDSAAAPLTRRVLRHLAGLGPLYENDIAGPERTQSGIASAVDSQQNVISKVLLRLTAAGAVACETRHVKGADRRVKVYSLTPYGESVARSYRVAGAGPPGSADPSDAR